MKKLPKSQTKIASHCSKFLSWFGQLAHSFVKRIFSASQEETFPVFAVCLKNTFQQYFLTVLFESNGFLIAQAI